MLTINNLEVRYFLPDNETAPTLEGYSKRHAKEQPDAVFFIKLQACADPVTSGIIKNAEVCAIKKALSKMQGNNSWFFSLAIPMQTRTLKGLRRSLFPTATSNFVYSIGNSAFACLASFFSLIIDLPTLPLRLITLIPRAMQQRHYDSVSKTYSKTSIAGKDIAFQSEKEPDWNRGILVTNDVLWKNGEGIRVREIPYRVYYLGC